MPRHRWRPAPTARTAPRRPHAPRATGDSGGPCVSFGENGSASPSTSPASARPRAQRCRSPRWRTPRRSSRGARQRRPIRARTRHAGRACIRTAATTTAAPTPNTAPEAPIEPALSPWPVLASCAWCARLASAPNAPAPTKRTRNRACPYPLGNAAEHREREQVRARVERIRSGAGGTTGAATTRRCGTATPPPAATNGEGIVWPVHKSPARGRGQELGRERDEDQQHEPVGEPRMDVPHPLHSPGCGRSAWPNAVMSSSRPSSNRSASCSSGSSTSSSSSNGLGPPWGVASRSGGSRRWG